MLLPPLNHLPLLPGHRLQLAEMLQTPCLVQVVLGMVLGLLATDGGQQFFGMLIPRQFNVWNRLLNSDLAHALKALLPVQSEPDRVFSRQPSHTTSFLSHSTAK